jgi:hypothetical protein
VIFAAISTYLLWHKAFKNSRYTEGYTCKFLKTFYHQHLSTLHPQKSLNSGKFTGVTGEWLLTGKGGMYGDEPREITKEEAIEALFGDKVDEVLLYMIEAIKDPFLRSILYFRATEYKEQQKK